MTAGQSAAGRDVESINEEAVEAACMHRFGSAWNSYTESAREWERAVMGGELATALPLLRPSEVPHVVTQVREQIAEEIEAKSEPDRSWRDLNFAERVNDTALLVAAAIARGSSS